MSTYTIELLQDITSKLVTAEQVLKTRDVKNKAFVATSIALLPKPDESCIIDTVTPDRNVAMVVICRYRAV